MLDNIILYKHLIFEPTDSFVYVYFLYFLIVLRCALLCI